MKSARKFHLLSTPQKRHNSQTPQTNSKNPKLSREDNTNKKLEFVIQQKLKYIQISAQNKQQINQTQCKQKIQEINNLQSLINQKINNLQSKNYPQNKKNSKPASARTSPQNLKQRNRIPFFCKDRNLKHVDSHKTFERLWKDASCRQIRLQKIQQEKKKQEEKSSHLHNNENSIIKSRQSSKSRDRSKVIGNFEKEEITNLRILLCQKHHKSLNQNSKNNINQSSTQKINNPPKKYPPKTFSLDTTNASNSTADTKKESLAAALKKYDSKSLITILSQLCEKSPHHKKSTSEIFQTDRDVMRKPSIIIKMAQKNFEKMQKNLQLTLIKRNAGNLEKLQKLRNANLLSCETSFQKFPDTSMQNTRYWSLSKQQLKQIKTELNFLEEINNQNYINFSKGSSSSSSILTRFSPLAMKIKHKKTQSQIVDNNYPNFEINPHFSEVHSPNGSQLTMPSRFVEEFNDNEKMIDDIKLYDKIFQQKKEDSSASKKKKRLVLKSKEIFEENFGEENCHFHGSPLSFKNGNISLSKIQKSPQNEDSIKHRDWAIKMFEDI